MSSFRLRVRPSIVEKVPAGGLGDHETQYMDLMSSVLIHSHNPRAGGATESPEDYRIENPWWSQRPLKAAIS